MVLSMLFCNTFYRLKTASAHRQDIVEVKYLMI